jgi:hypothetical protein
MLALRARLAGAAGACRQVRVGSCRARVRQIGKISFIDTHPTRILSFSLLVYRCTHGPVRPSAWILL